MVERVVLQVFGFDKVYPVQKKNVETFGTVTKGKDAHMKRERHAKNPGRYMTKSAGALSPSGLLLLYAMPSTKTSQAIPNWVLQVVVEKTPNICGYHTRTPELMLAISFLVSCFMIPKDSLKPKQILDAE